jgi:hypothetical protein
MKKSLNKGSYESYMEVVKRRIDYIKTAMAELPKQEWVRKLTYEQWVDFQNDKIKLFDPLTIEDVRRSREFNYHLAKGEIVKLDTEVMNDEEMEKYSDLIGLHAVITDSYSDLHSFGRGSAYTHHLTFENGFKTERCGCKYEEHIPTFLLIPISDEESEKYIKLYKTTKDKSKLWFIIDK